MGITIRNLRKSFGGVAAVKDIDLDIADGEMLVLLGPSGCGKTTTMRCIAGLESPTHGQISIGGRVVFDDAKGINVPVNKRNVGMVFQSYAIWPHMTVNENVSFPLKMEGVAKEETARRVEEILELVGLKDLKDRGASYLSGGQMQRVALARSLIMRPSVLLFDEPLSNLDARLRDHLRVQLRELQTQLKITSVYVTHDQQEALALADNVAVMHRGQVLQIDNPVNIYSHPRSKTIAEFIGYSNVFDVSVDARRSGGCEVTLLGTGRKLAAGEVPAGDDKNDFCICVRPNSVAIRALPDGEDGSKLSGNAFAGEVILVSFLGAYMQYRVRVSGQEIWEVISPNVTSDIRLGMRAVLEIAPHNLQVLSRS